MFPRGTVIREMQAKLGIEGARAGGNPRRTGTATPRRQGEAPDRTSQRREEKLCISLLPSVWHASVHGDAQDFEAIEQALRRQALRIAASTVARRLNEDHSDHSGSTTACVCGQTARYAGRRPKTFTSVLGPLTLERAYYYCDACRAGMCPRDRALGLHATSLSPGVLRMVGLAASDFSFAAASGLLWELAAVRVETKQVERAAEALGREVLPSARN